MDRIITDNHRVDIFAAINQERIRQDKIHPWDDLDVKFCDPMFHNRYIEEVAIYKKNNDEDEEMGLAYIDRLIYEEFCESFSETDPIKQREELIQLAALCIKVIEKIDKETKDNA